MRTDWIKDIIIAIVAIALFGVMLLILPKVLPIPIGISYILAFAVFIAFLAVMALTVIKKQVGVKYIKKPKTAKNKQ